MAKASPKFLAPSPSVGANSLVGVRKQASAASKMASSGVNISSNTSEAPLSSLSLPPDKTEQGLQTGERMLAKTDDAGGKAARVPLSPPIKARLVELFATFHTHKQAREIIQEEFGLILSGNQLSTHDPARSNCGLSKRLHAYFQEVRKRYVQGAADVAITHQAHRLRRLEEVHRAAMRAKDFTNAIKALEVAAKELGALSSEVKVTHSGTVGHVHATVEEAKQEVAMRLAGLIERAQIEAPKTGDKGGDSPSQAIDIIDVSDE